MRYQAIVRFTLGEEERLGGIRSVLADYSGYYAILLIRDFKDNTDRVVDSRSLV